MIPNDFATTTLNTAASVFTTFNLTPVLTLLAGVIVVIAVISAIIGLMHRR